MQPLPSSKRSIKRNSTLRSHLSKTLKAQTTSHLWYAVPCRAKSLIWISEDHRSTGALDKNAPVLKGRRKPPFVVVPSVQPANKKQHTRGNFDVIKPPLR